MMSTTEHRRLPLLPVAGDGRGLSPRTAIDSNPCCIPLVAWRCGSNINVRNPEAEPKNKGKQRREEKG